MGLTPTEIAQEIRDSEGIINGLLHECKRVERMMTDDEFFERTRKKVSDQLARLQKELYDIDEARNKGMELIGKYQAAVDDKRTLILQLRHHHKLAKLAEMRAKIADAEAELNPDEDEVTA